MADTRLICAPWADLTDLPDQRPDGVVEDQWEALLWMASEILWGLSGRQFSGGCESTVTLLEHRRTLGWADLRWPPLEAAGYGWPPGWTCVGGSEGRVVALPDPPVTSISAVTIDGQVLDPVDFDARLPVGHLTRRGAPWPVDGSLRVTYRHGIAPPIAGRQLAVVLAVELGRAFTADPDCKLPQRLQTITREGVTVGFQDTFEALDDGRTGVYPIDLWLASVNPAKLKRRARAWTPELRKARRTTT